MNSPEASTNQLSANTPREFFKVYLTEPLFQHLTKTLLVVSEMILTVKKAKKY